MVRSNSSYRTLAGSSTSNRLLILNNCCLGCNMMIMAKFLAGHSTQDQTGGVDQGFDSYSKDGIVVAYHSAQVLPLYKVHYQL